MFNPESVGFSHLILFVVEDGWAVGPLFLFLFLYMGTLSRLFLAAAHWNFWNRLGDHDEQRAFGLL